MWPHSSPALRPLRRNLFSHLRGDGLSFPVRACAFPPAREAQSLSSGCAQRLTPRHIPCVAQVFPVMKAQADGAGQRELWAVTEGQAARRAVILPPVALASAASQCAPRLRWPGGSVSPRGPHPQPQTLAAARCSENLVACLLFASLPSSVK